MNIIPNDAEITWGDGKSCKGSVRSHHEEGKLAFTVRDGQTLQGCPSSGAILRVAAPIEPDRYEIHSLEISPTVDNVCYVSVHLLPTRNL